MPQIVADNLALIVGIVVFAVIVAIGGLGEKPRHRRVAGAGASHGSPPSPWGGAQRAAAPRRPPARSARDAADQLRCVMEADFKPRPLLNKAEAQVFKALDTAVVARNPGWQVMAQVSLGEFLASPDQNAFLSVNSKRVDFALMDESCRVRHAIEYQGTGHHLPGGAAAARDAVKKEALRKAGIGYHEVVAGHTTPAELKRLVEKLVVAG